MWSQQSSSLYILLLKTSSLLQAPKPPQTGVWPASQRPFSDCRAAPEPQALWLDALLLLERLLNVDHLFNFHFEKIILSMLGIPKATPRFNASLAELLTVLSIQSFLWLWFTTIKRYKLNQQREKAHEVNRGDQTWAPKNLPVRSHTQCA